MAFYRCGGGGTPTGDAKPEDVLSPRTFSNNDGTGKVGTMTNASGNISISSGRQAFVNGVTIPRGYHDGTKKVSVATDGQKSIQAQRDAIVGLDFKTDNKVPSSIEVRPLKQFTGGCNIRNRYNEFDIYDSSALSKSIGADEYIRYVNTIAIPNSNSGVYTFPELLTQLKPQMQNAYREASAIASKNYSSGECFWFTPLGPDYAVEALADIHAGDPIRPHTNVEPIEAYYTFYNDGRQTDLLADNSFRYVNARNVYKNGYNIAVSDMTTTGSTAWGTDLNVRKEYTCPNPGLYLVIAFSNVGRMLDDTLLVWSDNGIVDGNSGRIEHLWGTDTEGGAYVIIKQVSDCIKDTKIHCRSTSSNCKQIKIIAITTNY